MTREEIIKESNELLKVDLLDIINDYHEKNNIPYYVNASFAPDILINNIEKLEMAVENRKIFLEENLNF